MFMTVNPDIDNVATPERIANITNIVIVFIGGYGSSLIYKATIYWRYDICFLSVGR